MALVAEASPISSGAMWVVEGMSGSPTARKRSFSLFAWRCCPLRSTSLILRWLALANAPAAIIGGSAVVKMNPGAKLRM